MHTCSLSRRVELYGSNSAATEEGTERVNASASKRGSGDVHPKIITFSPTDEAVISIEIYEMELEKHRQALLSFEHCHQILW